MIYGILILFAVQIVNYGQCADIDDAKALQEYLFANYSSEFRPLRNQSKQIGVTATFSLLDITEFDGVLQEFTCNGLFRFIWEDEFLVWNPKDFGGLDHFTFTSQHKSWFPVLILTNTRGVRDIFANNEQRITVLSNGTIEWFAGAIMKSSCPLNVKMFPFDIQKCFLYIIPIHYTSEEVRMSAGSDVVLLNMYLESSQWNILDTNFAVLVEGLISNWKITLRFQRRSLYYVITVFLQVVVLGVLNMAVFAIPAESGEKLSYSITIVLAMVVYMSYVSELLPKSSSGISMLTGYLATITASSSVNVLLTVSILRMHHFTAAKPVPQFLRRVTTTVEKLRNTRETGSDEVVNWKDVAVVLDYIFFVAFSSIFFIYSMVLFITLWSTL